MKFIMLGELLRKIDILKIQNFCLFYVRGQIKKQSLCLLKFLKIFCTNIFPSLNNLHDKFHSGTHMGSEMTGIQTTVCIRKF